VRLILLLVLGVLGFAGLPTGAQAESLLFSVNANANENINYVAAQDAYQPLATYIGGALGSSIKLVISQKPEEELEQIKSGRYAILLAPAHIIASALKNGYEPIAKFPGSNQTVFVTLKASGIADLQQAKGKVLALADKNSLATYLALGEIQAAKIPLSNFFSNITYSNYADSTLFALGIKRADVAAVDKAVADKWLKTNQGIVIAQSKSTPNLSIAVSSQMPKADQDKLRNALLSIKPGGDSPLARLKIAQLEPSSRADFAYVSTLGYVATQVTQGQTVVDAELPRDMMSKQNCFICHAVDHKVVGPAYKDVAKHYGGGKASAAIVTKLAQKVIKGGSGNWNAVTGGAAMVPHPELSQANAEKIVRWVLSQ
jgi:ABC-type phosphate/phosphonate transport system substrate-binding protein/cytochrome c551/c552